MLSAAAMPMPEPGPSLGRKWIKANAIAAVVYGAIAALTFAADGLLGTNPSVLARSVAAAITFAGPVVNLGAYAVLTGAVLGEALPALSRRGWIALHVLIGATVGSVLAAAHLFGGDASVRAPAPLPTDRTMLIGGALAIGIIAPFLGALMGSLQALVLRPAARGLGVWIACSTVASSTFFAALLGAAFLAAGQSSMPVQLLAMEAGLVAGLMVAALMLLLAVKRLAPRA
ncbi:MAG: hypothetical protein ACRECO_18570 [Xanthobacteraceae bacterium]